MLINKNKNVRGFSNNKKKIIGRGFVDSLSSMFNSIKASALPALKGVGSYLSTNKDQILKPLLGAVGTLGAKALTEGLPALINKIANKNKNKMLNTTAPEIDTKILDDPIYKKIVKQMQAQPVSNIIGSGIKKF